MSTRHTIHRSSSHSCDQYGEFFAPHSYITHASMSADSNKSSPKGCTDKCLHNDGSLNDSVIFQISLSIRTCQKFSATCSDCRLILKTVEVFRPGWINAHENDDACVIVRRGGEAVREDDYDIYTVRLDLGIPRMEDYFDPPESGISFQIFRRSQGRHRINTYRCTAQRLRTWTSLTHQSGAIVPRRRGLVGCP